MNSSVGPSRASYPMPMTTYDIQGAFENTLHGSQPGLYLEPCEVSAIILDAKTVIPQGLFHNLKPSQHRTVTYPGLQSGDTGVASLASRESGSEVSEHLVDNGLVVNESKCPSASMKVTLLAKSDHFLCQTLSLLGLAYGCRNSLSSQELSHETTKQGYSLIGWAAKLPAYYSVSHFLLKNSYVSARRDRVRTCLDLQSLSARAAQFLLASHIIIVIFFQYFKYCLVDGEVRADFRDINHRCCNKCLLLCI